MGNSRTCACAASSVAQHGHDKRVGRITVEGIEAVVEAAECDRIQRQPRHVGWDIDRIVRIQSLPLLHELDGKIEHPGK